MSTHTIAFHCSADWHLTRLGKYAAPVHSLALRVQQDDFFYGSPQQVADYFGADDKTIRNVFDRLSETGFFEEIEKRAGQTTIYRALCHTEWSAKYPGQCAVKKERNAPGTLPNSAPNLTQPVGIPNERVGTLPNSARTLPNSAPNLTQPVGNKSPKEVSEEVSEEVSDKFPKVVVEKNAAHSVSAIPSLSQTKQQEPSSKDNARRWLYKIWTATTHEPLSVRKTDLARLERFVGKHGEEKAARAWFVYVNAEPRPYNLEPVEMAVKRQYKNGQEWIQGAEDESKVTRFPLAAFFAVSDGYLVAAEESLNKYKQESFLKSFQQAA